MTWHTTICQIKPLSLLVYLWKLNEQNIRHRKNGVGYCFLQSALLVKKVYTISNKSTTLYLEPPLSMYNSLYPFNSIYIHLKINDLKHVQRDEDWCGILIVSDLWNSYFKRDVCWNSYCDRRWEMESRQFESSNHHVCDRF